MRFDLFICHAFEDKARFVEPLAEDLARMGVRVWYDEFSLRAGDSLREAIDYGIANSGQACVVLSRPFFSKGWTNWELGGILQRQLDRRGRFIIPIWLGIDKKTVRSFSESLADIVAIRAQRRNRYGYWEVARKIREAMSPRLEPGALRRLLESALSSRDRIHRERLTGAAIRCFVDLLREQLPALGEGTRRAVVAFPPELAQIARNPWSLESFGDSEQCLSLTLKEFQREDASDNYATKVLYSDDGSGWFYSGWGNLDSLDRETGDLSEEDISTLLDSIVCAIHILAAVFPESASAIVRESEMLRGASTRRWTPNGV